MAIASGWSEGGRDAGARAGGRGEVFPGLGVFIGVGVLMGVIPALVIAGRPGGSAGDLLAIVGQGASLGGILGLFVGLGRGVWRPGPAGRVPGPARAPRGAGAPAPELWDPWLDHGRDLGLDPAEPEAAIDEPVPATAPEFAAATLARAAVRPRVISPMTGDTIRLEEEIGPMLQAGRGGLFVILGGPGSGKTTALRHLAAILPPWARGRVRLLEELDLTAIASAGPDPVVVLAMETLPAATPGHEKVVVKCSDHEPKILGDWFSSRKPSLCRLAPWTDDDAIEYLLAIDREACASVMGRLKAAGDFAFLDGIAELCAVVLDRMARDASIGGVRTALRRELADRIGGASGREVRIADLCVDQFRNIADAERSRALAELAARRAPDGEPLARLIRHRPSALLLAADRIAALIECGRATKSLSHHGSRELVREVARIIAGNDAALHHLNRWIQGKRWSIYPLAASLLHAITPGWRPAPGRRPCLGGAFLEGAAWAGLDLKEGDLRRADLTGADLSGANLERALARRACLHGASLEGAVLDHWNANQADLGRADLSRVNARRAQFREADLTGARLVEAALYEADLKGARIDEADFTGANLENARLRGLPLFRARFEGARFGGADLRECDMEGMTLTGPDFHDACLEKALLTGSRMPDANFVGANLRRAGLAEIDWPGACLLDANLRGADFHLGSTRSGLVDSPIACEGSRTGFYTDDDLDRDIRPAEEIRKANLRGADIRGADIRDVDFYLVDLRDARYTEEQAEHLRRCRAILDD